MMNPDRSPDHAVTVPDMGHDMGHDMGLAPCRYPCPGCLGQVDADDYAEHIRGCVAVQARSLVQHATRVSGSNSFHIDTFLEVVWVAFELESSPAEAWGIDVLGKLPYVSQYKHGFYRYEAPE